MILALARWRAQAGDAALEHPRHVALLAIALGLGVGGSGAPVAMTAAAAGLVAAVGRWTPIAWPRMRVDGLALLVLIAALGAHSRVQGLEHTTLRPAFGQLVEGDAVVLAAPRSDAFGQQRALVRWGDEPVVLRFPPWRAAPGVAIGDIVSVRGTLRAPDRVAMTANAHASLLASVVEQTGRRRAGVRGTIDTVRRRAEAGLTARLPSTEGALLRGMVLGQDEALPDDVRDAFRVAGLSHLVAASGANIMLLVALVMGVAMALGLGARARWLLVLGLIALYVPLAGGGAPIQRAGASGAAMAIAVMAGRPASRWYAMALAAVATLALDPRSVGAVGWQLSFAAVVGIAVGAGPVRSALRARGAPRPLAEALAVTVAATLATAPILALRFGTVSLVSLPANLLAAPAVPVVMWLGMISGALAQVWPGLAGVVGGLAALPLAFIVALARIAAAVPGAEAGAVSGTLALLATAGVGAMLLRRGGHRPLKANSARDRVAAGLVAAAAVAAMVVVFGRRAVAPPVPDGVLRVTALDVGQGDATVVQAAGHAILVDAGPPGAPTVRELRRAGVGRLDALVVTHPQADHDGGAPAVLRALHVGLLLDGRGGDRSPGSRALDPALAAARTRIVPARAGEVLRAGPLALQVLWPPAGAAPPGGDPNDRAVVAVAAAFGSSALLTADAESPVLAPLDLPPVDVLKVSHHGSDDPGLPALIERLRPRVALVEVGRHNTYGHPAAPTMRALLAGVPIVRRTDRDGTVRIDLRHGHVSAVAEG